MWPCPPVAGCLAVRTHVRPGRRRTAPPVRPATRSDPSRPILSASSIRTRSSAPPTVAPSSATTRLPVRNPPRQRHSLAGDAQMRPLHTPVPDELGHREQRRVAGHREAQFLRTADHRGVDADHPPGPGDQRPAGVAGFERSVGLDDVVHQPPTTWLLASTRLSPAITTPDPALSRRPGPRASTRTTAGPTRSATSATTREYVSSAASAAPWESPSWCGMGSRAWRSPTGG